jgi:hypothetical protein
MGTVVPGEGKIAKMRVLVFFFSIPHGFEKTGHTFTGRFLLSSSIH